MSCSARSIVASLSRLSDTPNTRSRVGISSLFYHREDGVARVLIANTVCGAYQDSFTVECTRLEADGLIRARGKSCTMNCVCGDVLRVSVAGAQEAPRAVNSANGNGMETLGQPLI